LSRLRRVIAAESPLIAAVLLVGSFYVWTASGGWPFETKEPHDGHYDLLARALVRGQLHLTVEPPRELLEMSEPYEPGRNAPYRLHDASLYHGHYYLYFGVVPAVVLFVPWRLLGLGDLPQNLAALAFAMAGFVFSALLLRRLLRTHLGFGAAWMEATAFVTLGLASVVPFILRSPFVYEVAIAAGYCFLSGAAWLFASAGVRGKASLTRLFLGGLFLGLAVGCRPNLLVAVAPLGFVLVLLGAYNALRFGSPLEFGTRYQLAGIRPIAWGDPRAVPPTLFFDFLAWPAARLEFPFLFPSRDYPWTTPAGYFKDTSTTGALAHSPFLLVLLAAPYLLRRAAVAEHGRLMLAVAALVGTGLALPLATSYAFSSAAMRFQVDFVSFLAVPALLLWFLGAALADRRVRRCFRYGGLALIAWSVVTNLCLSVTGASDGLRRDNPALFATLAASFEPVRIALGRALDPDGRKAIRLRMALPEGLSAEAEPLVSSGTVDAHDMVWVLERAPGRFAFAVETADGATAVGAPQALEPRRFYDVEIVLDRVARKVVVKLDDAEAAWLPARLGPVRADTLWLGRAPRGKGARDRGRFSGTLISQAMLWAGRPGLESLPPVSAAPAIFTETGDGPPATLELGQLWVPAGRDGAFLFTRPGWRWIPRSFVDRVRVERLVRFAALPTGALEPVFLAGDGSGADGVCVRHDGRGGVAFLPARWREQWTFGAPGAALVAPPEGARMAVVLDRPARRLVVEVDGRSVLDVAADLRAIDRSTLTLGQSPSGVGLLGRGAFAGAMRPMP
jgi:hypothetical protein